MLIDFYLSGTGLNESTGAKRLEELGFDGLCCSESRHDPFLAMLAASHESQRADLYTSIAVALARSPLDIAYSANDLRVASHGRFVLGLGTQIRPHIERRFSMPWVNPVEQMREIVVAIRSIFHSWATNEPLDFHGKHYRHTLMTPAFTPEPHPYGPPPIWIAALGPQMTSMAAEVGDGLILHPFHTLEFIRSRSIPWIQEGLDRAGRTREDLTVVASVTTCTGATDEEMTNAERAVRNSIAYFGSTPAFRTVLETHGWGDLQPELSALVRAGQWGELASRIPDEMLDLFVVRGRPEQLGELVRGKYGGIADRVALEMPYQASARTIDAIAAGLSV